MIRQRRSRQSQHRPLRINSAVVIPLFMLAWVGALFVPVLFFYFPTGQGHGNNTSDTTYKASVDRQKQSKAQKPAAAKSADASSLLSPVQIAHVVSLVKCSKVAQTTGFLDAAAVLRHSIHKQSIHSGASKYSYKMYAIVHADCESHAPVLERLGYTSLIRETPVRLEDIKGEWYKDHVEGENCCGIREFIKLYAYELTQHPIAVHWDLDVAVLQPMDDLFDAMLFPATSERGKKARLNLKLQHPSEPLPNKIDAFFTRDITSSWPWEQHQGVQGGFLVARPSLDDLQTYIDFITEGNYTRGRSEGSGWGGLGYGGFQGAMAYQGAVAYFYDRYRPNTAVELNVCRWNQVVADVIWRGPFRMQHHLQCRQYPKNGNFTANTQCEDCRITPIELTKTVHYTACKKPWECAIPYPRDPKNKAHVHRLSHLTNITTCGGLVRKWFELRQAFEDELQRAGGVMPSTRNGKFRPDFFMGNCKQSGAYIAMNPPPEDFDIKRIYGM